MPELSKTTDHALRLLLELGEGGPASATQLSRSLSLNRTVLRRLLATLHARGFVSRRSDGDYALGPILAWLGELVEPVLRAAALPAMEQLSRTTGETVVLWLLDGSEAVAINQVVGDRHLVRVQFPIGSKVPLDVASSGRVLLAFQERPFVERILRKASDPGGIRQLLEDVRAAGYAISHDELQRGVHGAAAPIFDRDGRAVACLALIVPSSRASLVETYVEELRSTVAEISPELGRPGRPLVGADVAAGTGAP